MDKRFVNISGPDFGKRLKRYRHAAGFTRQQLEFESGVSERTIIKFESGRGQGVKDSTLVALCQALNISLDELIPPQKPPVKTPLAINKTERVNRNVPWKGLFAAASVLVMLVLAWSLTTSTFSSQQTAVVRDTVSLLEKTSPGHAAINASRFYVEGKENLKRLFRDEARENFRLALEHDSTHAMSYVMLLHPDLRGSRDESLELIAKARENEDKLNPCEKLLLGAMEALVNKDRSGAIDLLEELVGIDPRQAAAYRILARLYLARRDYPEAIGCLNAAVTADTSDGMSFNRLAYVYMHLGKFDDALAAVDKYSKLCPLEPNPHDTRGDILVRMGRIDEAVNCYRTALDRKKDFFPSLQNLGEIYLLEGDYKKAEGYYRKLGEVDDPGARCRSSLFLACIPLFEGKLEDSLKMLEHCARVDTCSSRLSESCVSNAVIESHILVEMGKKEMALRKFENATAADLRNGGYGNLGRSIHYVQFLSAVDNNLAKTFVDSLKLRTDRNGEGQEFKYWFCKGWIELCDDKPEAAIEWFKRASAGRYLFCFQYQLAVAYLKAGKIDQAIEAFETALKITSTDRVQFALWSIKAHYYLGVALLESGRRAQAEEEFAEFLDMWKDADWEFEEIAAAKKYLARFSLNQSASK